MNICARTRVKELLRAGVLHTDQTTIDYVLADHLTLRGITNLEFIHDANLDSDHKVLLLSTRWRYHRVSRPTTLNRALKRKLKFEGRSDSLHSEFESRCEPEMVRLCAMFRSLPGDASQAVIDDCATALTDTISKTAEQHYGVKWQGKSTKTWFDAEIKALFNIKDLARRVLLASEAWRRTEHSTHLRQNVNNQFQRAHDIFKRTKRLLRSTIRAKRRAKDRHTFDEIEQAHGRSKLYWSLWKRKANGVSKDTLPDTVRNEDGVLEADPIKV